MRRRTEIVRETGDPDPRRGMGTMIALLLAALLVLLLIFLLFGRGDNDDSPVDNSTTIEQPEQGGAPAGGSEEGSGEEATEEPLTETAP